MKDRYVVIDDVFDQDTTTRLYKSVDNSTRNPFFYKLGESHFHDNFSYATLDVASNYFNLKTCIGYEFWTRLNRCVGGWHQDKDERLFDGQSVVKFPLCSIIYYPYVDMKGGELLLGSDKILPKTNRLVIFAAGIPHNVEDFTGNRISMMVNAWDSYVSNN